MKEKKKSVHGKDKLHPPGIDPWTSPYPTHVLENFEIEKLIIWKHNILFTEIQ